MLQRAGLRDTAFIAMSNYYYDEKNRYLASLNEVGDAGHDLTAFLKFALRGIAVQSQRLANEIRRHVSKEIFRSFAHDLFTRLLSPRKTLIAKRQLAILEQLLKRDETDFEDLAKTMTEQYTSVKNPRKALVRDVDHLSALGAIFVVKVGEGRFVISVRLDWPSELSERAIFERVRSLPKAKTRSFLAGG
jgi:Fic family protein